MDDQRHREASVGESEPTAEKGKGKGKGKARAADFPLPKTKVSHLLLIVRCQVSPYSETDPFLTHLIHTLRMQKGKKSHDVSEIALSSSLPSMR